MDRCTAHLNPADWICEPDPRRQDWGRYTCKYCGAFIGYGPINKQNLEQKDDT